MCDYVSGHEGAHWNARWKTGWVASCVKRDLALVSEAGVPTLSSDEVDPGASLAMEVDKWTLSGPIRQTLQIHTNFVLLSLRSINRATCTWIPRIAGTRIKNTVTPEAGRGTDWRIDRNCSWYRQSCNSIQSHWLVQSYIYWGSSIQKRQ